MAKSKETIPANTDLLNRKILRAKKFNLKLSDFKITNFFHGIHLQFAINYESSSQNHFI